MTILRRCSDRLYDCERCGSLPQRRKPARWRVSTDAEDRWLCTQCLDVEHPERRSERAR